MKTKTILVAILSLGILFTSCLDDDLHIVPSNNITSKTLSVSGFNKLDISDPFIVQVTFSETEESVVVESNDNIHQLIEINQQGETLNIGLYKNSNISGVPVLNVYIKTSSIENIKAEGATKVEFQNQLVASYFEMEFNGASTFQGSLNVDELISKLYGASTMNISGISNSFEIRAEGASKMMDFNFETNSLNANLNGASDISLTVNEKLNVKASGASNVYYKGNGVIESMDLSGASNIVKMD